MITKLSYLLALALFASSIVCAEDAPKTQEVTIPAGTKLALRLTEDVNSAKLREHQEIMFATAGMLPLSKNVVVAPGIPVVAGVVSLRKPGMLFGKASFSLRFDSIDLNTEKGPISFPLQVSRVVVAGKESEGGVLHLRSPNTSRRDLKEILTYAAPFLVFRRGEQVRLSKGMLVEVVLAEPVSLPTAYLPLMEIVRMCPCPEESGQAAEGVLK